MTSEAVNHAAAENAIAPTDNDSNLNGEKLYQLVYLSSAEHLLEDSELVSILAASRRNNIKRNVTGLLLYHDGNFIQFLEGPAHQVDALYERISLDVRHRGVLRLLRREIAKRDFGEWTMGFKALSADSAPEEIDGFNNMMSTLSAHQVADQTMSRTVQRLITSYRQLWGSGAMSNTRPRQGSTF
ncbi:hypothetical protein PYCC9005_002359 [Savitreella phatthalungensis]